MTKRVADIAVAIGGTLLGEGSVEIKGVASLEDAVEGTISFLADIGRRDRLISSRASAFIVPAGVEACGRPVIVVDNPQLVFIDIVNLFHPAPPPAGIDNRSFVGKTARVGDGVTIYPYVYVGEGAVLGDSVVLHPGVYVGKNSRIGSGSILHPNVVIGDGCEVGERAIIHGGSVIGSDGFGFVWDGGRHRKIPQVGRVVIGDDVEIGANSAIDRATLGKTEIKSGTKIDNLVHIAHNCAIGEDCIITGQAGFAGSVKVGRNVVMAGQVGVADHVTIGNGVMIGAKSGITKDIKDGAKVSGYPSLPHIEWLKVQKSLEKLPEMRKQLKALAKIIEGLEVEDA